jgi:hypothetical protein
LREIVCPVLEFRKKNQTFAKVKREKMDFFRNENEGQHSDTTPTPAPLPEPFGLVRLVEKPTGFG